MVAVSACGDNLMPEAGIRSGARLRAMYFTDAEGDRLFRGWFDRELGVECRWTGGDAPRCLPDLTPTSQFLDARCTEPLAEVLDPAPPGACAAPPPGYVGVGRDPCDAAAIDEVWPLTGETVAVTVVYDYDATAGTCTPREPAATPRSYYRAGPKLDRDHFVRGTVAALGRARIRSRTILGDDGSMAPLGAFDTELGAACAPSEADGCVPDAARAVLAEDAACTRPVITAATACEPPAIISAGHGSSRTLFERGALVTADPERDLLLYDMSVFIAGQGWSCSELTGRVNPGYGAYRAGREIPLTALAPAEARDGEGARIRPSWLVAGDHRELVGYRDAQLGFGCAPAQVAPGEWRCLPVLPYVTRVFFADAACTEPLPLIFDFGEGPAGLPGTEAVPEGSCGRRLRAYAPGAERAPQSYYYRAGGTCEPWGTPDFPVHAFELGPEVSLEPFPALAPVTE